MNWREHIVPAALTLITAVAFVITARKESRQNRIEPRVRVSDVPKIYRQLERQGRDGSFAAFIVPTEDRHGAGEAVNVQFSMEGERLGLDWVLESAGNRAERDRFVHLATSRGYTVLSREKNGVAYLRVEEGGSLPALCMDLMMQFSDVGPDDYVDLIGDGFDWPE